MRHFPTNLLLTMDKKEPKTEQKNDVLIETLAL
jgi:hypothetical protein